MVKQIARPTMAGTLFWEKDAWESGTKKSRGNEDNDVEIIRKVGGIFLLLNKLGSRSITTSKPSLIKIDFW